MYGKAFIIGLSAFSISENYFFDVSSVISKPQSVGCKKTWPLLGLATDQKIIFDFFPCPTPFNSINFQAYVCSGIAVPSLK